MHWCNCQSKNTQILCYTFFRKIFCQKSDCRKHSKPEIKPSWSAGTAEAVKFGERRDSKSFQSEAHRENPGKRFTKQWLSGADRLLLRCEEGKRRSKRGRGQEVIPPYPSAQPSDTRANSGAVKEVRVKVKGQRTQAELWLTVMQTAVDCSGGEQWRGGYLRLHSPTFLWHHLWI